ncbi:hypothetical protein HQO82_02485 [Rhodococcus fascians]|nr:hypothetical protein [Rhodococcus fascians]MBY4112677.1 hypothetical protein [Rhodococcus fascians]
MSDDARSAPTDETPTDAASSDGAGDTETTGNATDSEEPQVDDATLEEAKKSVEGLDDRYRPGARPTVALPGTNGTVAGTAFADMVDGDGELVDADDQNNRNEVDQPSDSDKVASSTDG